MHEVMRQQSADKAATVFKWQKGIPGPTRLPPKFADAPRVVGTAVALIEEEDDVEAVVRDASA